MKYRLEYPPNNPLCLIIHINIRVTDEAILEYQYGNRAGGSLTGEEMPEYMKNIFAIAGVEKITLYQHAIAVQKGEMFSWEEMLPMMIFAINGELDPGREAIEQKPTM